MPHPIRKWPSRPLSCSLYPGYKNGPRTPVLRRFSLELASILTASSTLIKFIFLSSCLMSGNSLPTHAWTMTLFFWKRQDGSSAWNLIQMPRWFCLSLSHTHTRMERFITSIMKLWGRVGQGLSSWLRDALGEEGQESGMEFYDIQGLGLGVGWGFLSWAVACMFNLLASLKNFVTRVPRYGGQRKRQRWSLKTVSN